MRIASKALFLVFIIAGCSNPVKEPEKKIISFKKPENKAVSAEKDSTAVFRWESELCTHESTFDTRLYTEEELRGTRRLLQMTGSVLLEVKDVAFKPDQIADLSTLKELDLEYQTKRKQLQDMTIVNDSYWIKIKERLLVAMKDEYDLSRICIQAYTNPKVLKGNRFSKYCPDLITALTSNDSTKLIAAWKTLVEEQCKKNASPDYLMERFERESHDPDWMMYGRIELVTFGFSNRVNDQIEHVKNDEAINRKFDQLFLKTHSECDEP
jgi:hypothetical protein